MKHKFAILALMLVSLLGNGTLPLRAAGQTTIDSPGALTASIQSVLNQPRYATAAWGVKIVSLESGQTLFEQNAGKLLKPASNNKLFTGALALDQLGPDFRIKTSCYAKAPPSRSGTLAGDLIVYGRGDPSMAARFHDGDYTKSLTPLVDAIAKAGVKRIKGDLVGDESFFKGAPFGNGWTWDDLQYYYGAEVSALTLQDNVLDLTFHPGAKVGDACQFTLKPATDYVNFINRTRTAPAGAKRTIEIYRPVGQNLAYLFGQLPLDDKGYDDAVTVNHPAAFFIAMLKDALRQRGIKVEGQLRTVNWLDRQTALLDRSQLTEIASVDSRPVSECVMRMMKPSQNLYAQLLFLQAGAQAQSDAASDMDTEDRALQKLHEFLAKAGVSLHEIAIEEGSGLSRAALVTPNSIVTLLTFMSRHPQAETFRNALPIAGVDGSLYRRMKKTAAQGNVHAKTGSLGHVATLSGYVTSAAGEHLVFSLMLNNYEPSESHPVTNDLDAIAIALANLSVRSSESR